MTTRAEQREETRRLIIAAAGQAFSERGFRAASTRDIATRAGVNQGLITYHFRSKERLWKATLNLIFEELAGTLRELADISDSADPRERGREAIRRYVRFAAAHPELFRLMVEEGKQSDARLRWLVDTHLKPFYAGFERLVAAHSFGFDRAMLPHAFYTLAGAGSMIFAIRPECRRLTGVDPAGKQVIEAHAEFVARLLVP
jgi:TetR/AcrR family transcriptional regulator